MHQERNSTKGSILFVDDDTSVSNIMSRMIKEFGHQVDVAGSGEEALERIRQRDYDIVITDIRLPGIDGMRVLEEILVISPETDVIAVTGYGSIESAVEFMKAGALDYLTKPINGDHLEIVIRKAMERKDLIKAARERDYYLKMSLTDALTGIFNHRYFQQQITREITKSIRSGESLSMMMLDIDDFKHINDTFGHQAGDQVLRDLSDNLGKSCRFYDIITRYGGEEFAVIMPSTSVGNAVKIARRILENVSSQVHSSIQRPITLSIGISNYPLHASCKEDLIRKADLALYNSKARGKNTYTVYSESLSTPA